MVTSHHERHGLRHRVCGLTGRDRTVQENHCLIGQALKTAGRYEHTVLDPGYLQGLEIPLGNAAAAAAVTRNPFPSQIWLVGGWLGLSPVGEGFSPGQVAFRLKAPWKCRWLDSPVHGVQPEALGLMASLFGNISRLWKSRQETLQ